jgi:hypothetical protein
MDNSRWLGPRLVLQVLVLLPCLWLQLAGSPQSPSQESGPDQLQRALYAYDECPAVMLESLDKARKCYQNAREIASTAKSSDVTQRRRFLSACDEKLRAITQREQDLRQAVETIRRSIREKHLETAQTQLAAVQAPRVDQRFKHLQVELTAHQDEATEHLKECDKKVTWDPRGALRCYSKVRRKIDKDADLTARENKARSRIYGSSASASPVTSELATRPSEQAGGWRFAGVWRLIDAPFSESNPIEVQIVAVGSVLRGTWRRWGPAGIAALYSLSGRAESDATARLAYEGSNDRIERGDITISLTGGYELRLLVGPYGRGGGGIEQWWTGPLHRVAASTTTIMPPPPAPKLMGIVGTWIFQSPAANLAGPERAELEVLDEGSGRFSCTHTAFYRLNTGLTATVRLRFDCYGALIPASANDKGTFAWRDQNGEVRGTGTIASLSPDQIRLQWTRDESSRVWPFPSEQSLLMARKKPAPDPK